MEAREMYLYKLSKGGFGSPAYVAAENQQQAVEKKGSDFNTDECTLTVEYIGMVTV